MTKKAQGRKRRAKEIKEKIACKALVVEELVSCERYSERCGVALECSETLTLARNRLDLDAPCLAASLFGEEDSGQEGKREDCQCRVTFSAFMSLLESKHSLT